MGPTLPARQAEELHRSIIAYLTANNLRTSATALRQEMNLGEDVFDEPTTKKYETLLEKKWTLIGRLQKKIQELESRNTALQTELDSATPTSVSRRNQNPASWLPRAPPRHTLESHRHPINCLAFHPIFSSIATGSEDCTIKIWDWELGELERTIKSHTRTVLDVDYGGPRGAILLASCSSDLTIKLWNPADEYKNIRTLIGHDHIVSAVRFIPSSANLLVSASRDQSLRIWDVNTGYCMKKIDGHTGWVRDVCPSFDGRYLVSTGDDTSVRLWDISQPTPECKLTMVGHDNFNECCALAPPSTYQYLAPLSGLKKPPPASSAAEFMATGSRDKNIKLWDARGACILTLAGHDNWVRALAFHPGGKYLFSVSDDKTLRCWDLAQDGKCVKVLRDTHDRFVTCLRWAPGIVKEAAPAANGDGRNGEVNGVRDRTSSVAAPEVQIRCVIATGGVDAKLRIFAN